MATQNGRPSDRRFVEHISLRVPWHDAGWDGTVCRDPHGNGSCVLLKSIGEQRDDRREQQLAGRLIADLRESDRPPCVVERATFMSPHDLTVTKAHPFAYNKALSGLRPTPVALPAYSAHAIPYRWMLREQLGDVLAQRDVAYHQELEDEVDRLMGGKRPSTWVMHGHNQEALFAEFFSAVRADESLAFFYAKHSPLSDDPRRVLVGAARVTGVELPGRYATDGPEQFPTSLWETVIRHSLRPDRRDGVLLPYQAILAAADEDPALDITDAIAFAPDTAWESFSYVTEHVSHDAAIEALVAIERAGRSANQLVGGLPPAAFEWIDTQLNRLWRLRGPCPGLGSALCAFGVERGTLLARALVSHIREGDDPWPAVDAALTDPARFGGDVASLATPSLRAKWARLPQPRRRLLQLLSRFDLTPEQAERFYLQQAAVDESALLANPFLLYEDDRAAPDPVGVAVVDRGVFPEEPVASAHPLPAPSAMADPLDPRRVRALLVDTLEQATDDGHTLLPERELVSAIRERPLTRPCPLDLDALAAFDLSAAAMRDAAAPGPLVAAQLADGTDALQLARLAETRRIIRRQVEQRLKAPRHAGVPDFAQLLDDELGALPDSLEDRALEQKARHEKTEALGELFASRVSVLVGPAGTGKTTVLKVLCHAPEVHRGGVLLLAPTGKARVQLTTKVERDAQTIAQFLLRGNRYDPTTGRYRATGDSASRVKGFKTVVLDEASMLTEEQLAATLDALAGVERLILVGDHRQLPPIGAGRPFVDVVTRLAPDGIEQRFPRVAAGYAEFTVLRRQAGTDRDDLRLAAWFGGAGLPADADEVWQRLRDGTAMPTLRAVPWRRGELEQSVLELLQQELHLPAEDTAAAFETSYGGSRVGDRVYFNWGEGGAGEGAERWQLLSPVRARGWGTVEINRALKRRFRGGALEAALRPPHERWVAKPIGPERIVYGDKVINLINRRVSDKNVWPQPGALGFIANGEIGVVVGQVRSRKVTWTPNKTEVEFSSQPGFKYTFRDWGDADAPLELAWAITVHKAQGSEFELTILVLPERTAGLSRELLYTALTRQRQRIVLLHEGPLDGLIDLAAPGSSETARRLTNLFADPAPVQVAGAVLEDRLVHRTRGGVLVRSKSEVIIADLLTALDVDWTYEEPFVGDNGTVRRPDFTVRTDAGATYLWEHLGMLDDPVYQARWQAKLAWYAMNGVRPFEDGGGTRASLIVTDEVGGADSARWEKTARQTLCL